MEHIQAKAVAMKVQNTFFQFSPLKHIGHASFARLNIKEYTIEMK